MKFQQIVISTVKVQSTFKIGLYAVCSLFGSQSLPLRPYLLLLFKCHANAVIGIVLFSRTPSEKKFCNLVIFQEAHVS